MSERTTLTTTQLKRLRLLHHVVSLKFAELAQEFQDELDEKYPALFVPSPVPGYAKLGARHHRDEVKTLDTMIVDGSNVEDDYVIYQLEQAKTKGVYMKGACVEPAVNTIQMQGYGPDGKMAGCSTRSSFDVSKDMHVMDAAWMFNDAARRGVVIVNHRVENILITTVVKNPVSSKKAAS